MSHEFEAALVAIAAVAFAMEALDNELKVSGHEIDPSLFEAPKPTNAGFYVAQRIAQAFNLDASAAERFEADLVLVFGLRNNSVHFTAQWREGVHPHPSGTNTAYELTLYTLEAAEAAIRLGRDVLVTGVDANNAGRLFAGAVDLGRELPGVVAMLDEVMRAEGIASG